MPKFILLLSILLFISGCASTVKTNLASYGTPSQIQKSQSIALVAADLKKEESLEFQHYKALVRQKLIAAGYRMSDMPQQADLIAEFDYSASPPRQQTTYYTQRPAFGPFGGISYGYRTGPWRRHAYRSTYFGYSFPLGGDYEERRTSTKTYYDRSVSLILKKPAETKRIYESKIEGSSICSRLEPVLATMIDHLLTDFPKTKQESQTITLPDNSC